MKLKPLGDRLIVRAIEEEQTTASGLVLPDTARRWLPIALEEQRGLDGVIESQRERLAAKLLQRDRKPAASSVGKHQSAERLLRGHLPTAHGRERQHGLCRGQPGPRCSTDTARIEVKPEEDMGVQQAFH